MSTTTLSIHKNGFSDRLSLTNAAVFISNLAIKLSCRGRGIARHGVRRALSLALIFSLLTTSTPAAPQTIVALGKESKVSFAFWLQSSGLSNLLQNRGV